MNVSIEPPSFSQRLLDWYDQYGRKNLPWQNPREPYKVWLSEIMLQQTQVKTVIPYFNRFIQRFPTIERLAEAEEDEVLSLWSGLGYYSRARNLHQTAQRLVTDHHGIFPQFPEALIQFPGIGESTAAAISSQAFNHPAAILDGNVKRVLSRYFQVDGWPQKKPVHNTLLQLAKDCMPSERCADYTQAIMDLGSICCKPKQPACQLCPLQSDCLAYINKVVINYPNKKPKKALPTYHQQFLVIHNDKNQIYLEKRPAKGIWGGLWCLPVLDMKDCLSTFIQHQYHLKKWHVHQLMTFKHSFTHFHLYIDAKSIQLHPSDHLNPSSQGRWFTQNQLQSIGLSKPMSKILDAWHSNLS